AHVLCIETDAGVVLVDSGIGLDDVRDPEKRLGRAFLSLVRPELDEGITALRQIEALGYQARDVRHVVLTHLDVDHAGGLPDFPAADVHLMGREHDTMLRPPLRERQRYFIGRRHWSHGPRWVTHEASGEEWRGLESVRVIPGTD